MLSKTAFKFSKVSKIIDGALKISVPDIVTVIEKSTLKMLPVYTNLFTVLATFKRAMVQ